MVNKKFFKLLNALSKLGLSSSSDSIKCRVPRLLIFNVLSVALDNDFTILIDEYDENKERYTITFKYLPHE